MNLSLRPLGGSLSPEEDTSYIPLIEDNHVPGIQAAVEAETEKYPDYEEDPEPQAAATVDDGDDFICPGEGLIRSPTNCSVYYNCLADEVGPHTALQYNSLPSTTSSRVRTDSTSTPPSPLVTGRRMS